MFNKFDKPAKSFKYEPRVVAEAKAETKAEQKPRTGSLTKAPEPKKSTDAAPAKSETGKAANKADSADKKKARPDRPLPARPPAGTPPPPPPPPSKVVKKSVAKLESNSDYSALESPLLKKLNNLFCHKCGEKFNSDAKFCGKCGTGRL